MKKTKEIVNQERRFFRLCSEEYREMVRKKRKMTLNDFDRIFYVLITLKMTDYAIYFAMQLFSELLTKSNNYISKMNAIYELQYSQEDNLYAEMDKSKVWLQEFWEQMPLESQKKKYRDIFAIDMDLAEDVITLF